MAQRQLKHDHAEIRPSQSGQIVCYKFDGSSVERVNSTSKSSRHPALKPDAVFVFQAALRSRVRTG
jgi:hypothetical protein